MWLYWMLALVWMLCRLTSHKVSAVGNHMRADIQCKEHNGAFIQQFYKREYGVSDILDTIQANILFILVSLAEIDPESNHIQFIVHWPASSHWFVHFC